MYDSIVIILAHRHSTRWLNKAVSSNAPIKQKDSSCPEQLTCTTAYIAFATASLFLLVITKRTSLLLLQK